MTMRRPIFFAELWRYRMHDNASICIQIYNLTYRTDLIQLNIFVVAKFAPGASSGTLKVQCFSQQECVSWIWVWQNNMNENRFCSTLQYLTRLLGMLHDPWVKFEQGDGRIWCCTRRRRTIGFMVDTDWTRSHTVSNI